MGEVVAIRVDYLTEIADGPKKATVHLEDMLQHCRAERIQDLLEDLTVLIEDVLAERQPKDPGRPLSP